NAFRNALATWAAQTTLSFSQSTPPIGQLVVQFVGIDGAGNTLANGQFPSSGGVMNVDTAENWSVAARPAATSMDLQTILVHERGHLLGLDHSSFPAAIMYPTFSLGVVKRDLDIDDKVAISVWYDTWVQTPGSARDIAVGANGAVWVIGTDSVFGGFS